MVTRYMNQALGFAALAFLLICSGCADMQVLGNFRVQSQDVYGCREDLVTPYPPYCHSERW
jgi:hypothetical protein